VRELSSTRRAKADLIEIRTYPLLSALFVLTAALALPCAAAPGRGDEAPRPPLPAFGRSVQIDPDLSGYHGRTRERIAADVRAAGYRVVHYVVTADSRIDATLLSAFRKAGIGTWYLTFGNGAYNTQDMPSGWHEWRMVTRSTLEGKPDPQDYTLLCLNNPAYREWKKRQIAHVLRTFPFVGVDIAEPHWPEYPGITCPVYGCFCSHCLAAFHRQFPEETHLPDIIHPDSPDSPSRNPALWRKWLAFRRASLTDFLNDLVNGPGGIRRVAPSAKVCTWTLALRGPDGLKHVHEDNGEDAGAIARVVRPDLHCFQTHWPDWTQADLPPDYVRGYRPFLDEIRAVAPHLPLMVQADIGSQPQNRRTWKWIHAFERACEALGIGSTTLYEFSIGADRAGL
jgi:hypothetical protein